MNRNPSPNQINVAYGFLSACLCLALSAARRESLLPRSRDRARFGWHRSPQISRELNRTRCTPRRPNSPSATAHPEIHTDCCLRLPGSASSRSAQIFWFSSLTVLGLINEGPVLCVFDGTCNVIHSRIPSLRATATRATTIVAKVQRGVPPPVSGSLAARRSTIRVARATFRPVRFAPRAVRRTARRAFRIAFRPARRILRAARRPIRLVCRADRRLARLTRRFARLACLFLRGMCSSLTMMWQFSSLPPHYHHEPGTD